MHVNLEKMRCWQAKIPILLTVALVVLNAQCFAYCLTQAADTSATHCHQNGQTKGGHCSLQHDVTAGSSSPALAPVDGVWIAPVELPGLAIDPTSRHDVELLAASPPTPFSEATPLPLRV
jgi:hypothetical protein